jgi:hypothetical protein
VSEKVRFTYVARGGGRPYVAQPPSVEMPRWTLSSMREGVDYILGAHDPESEEARALLAAYKLAESAG